MTVTLIDPPEGRQFHIWRIDELYFGGTVTPGTRFRPRVGDKMVDWDEGEYRIVAVSSEGIPTLEKKISYLQEGSFDPESVSLVTPFTEYQPNASTAIFFDSTTSPYTCTVDSRYPVLSQDATSMIFYKGTDVSVNGTIISEVRDINDNVISNEIPLIAIDPTKPAVKRPVPFVTSTLLTAGDTVTGVAYSAATGPTTKTIFAVEESAAIRPADLSGIFLEDIELVSDLIDPSDDTLLLNKLGTPFRSSLVQARLKYSDGSTTVINIDGNKCKLPGVDRFDTSSLVRPTTIVLSYYPDSNEPAVNLNGSTAPSISKIYRLANIVQDTNYSLKLFVVPEYQDPVNGYTLRWWLNNLERDVNLDVTANVVARRPDLQNFIGNAYNVEQEITASLNLDDVIPVTYNGYVHSQLVDITVGLPNGASNAFLIDYLGDGINVFGDGLSATVTTDAAGTINLSSGKATQTEWLSYMLTAVAPLFDTSLMTTPPVPTHFRYIYDGIESPEFEITDWDSDLPKTAGIANFAADKTVDIVWLIQDSGNWDVLGHTPLITST
ncbi:hypothetical protein [Vibrio phage BONAISHI]|nr:hypothetical protein [Vibrio phage BONAISHI]